MKIASQGAPVAVQGIAHEAEEYKIELGAHTFDILSGLYKNIEAACVREPFTNMLDGYTALLRLNPDAVIRAPEVHLPTIHEPWIEFKDFGSGMDHATVMHVFKTYGASTKRDNNDEVGGLGIGSKAPFAYKGTDQWLLQCRENGQMRTYNAHRNERGVPALVLISETPTNEPNGVTVRIPIPQYDFYKFKNELVRLLPYYPMDVKITGDTNVSWSRPEYTLKGTGWGLKAGANTSYVIMGNVPYSVTGQWLSEHTGLPRDLFHRWSLDIHAPIGFVDVLPSREGLKDTQHTFNGIKQVAGLLVREFREQVAEQIKDAPTKWDAMMLLRESYGVSALRKELTGIQWRGETLDLTIGIEVFAADVQKEYPDLKIFEFSNEGRAAVITKEEIGKVRLIPGHENVWVLASEDPEIDKSRAIRYDMAMKVGAPLDKNAGTKLVSKADLEAEKAEDDYRPRRRRRRGSRYANHAGYTYVFVAKDLTADKLQEILSGHPVESALALEDPPKPERGKSTRTKTKVKKLTNYSRYPWEDVDIIIEDGGFFVGLERGDILDFHGDADDLQRVITMAKSAGILPEDAVIYGIPRTLKSIEKKPGWKQVTGFVNAQAMEIAKAHAKEIAEYATWEPVIHHNLADLVMVLDLSHLGERSFAKKFKACIEKWRANEGRLDSIKEMVTRFGLNFPEVKEPKVKGYEMLEQFTKKYPLLSLANDMVRAYNLDGTVVQNGYSDAVRDYLRAA